jgi:hypothetical protein
MVVTAKNRVFCNAPLCSVVNCKDVSGKPPAVIIRVHEYTTADILIYPNERCCRVLQQHAIASKETSVSKLLFAPNDCLSIKCMQED